MNPFIALFDLIVVGLSCWIIATSRAKKREFDLQKSLALMCRGRMVSLNQMAFLYLKPGIQCSPLIVKILTLTVMLKDHYRHSLILFAEDSQVFDLKFLYSKDGKVRSITFSMDGASLTDENEKSMEYSWPLVTATVIEDFLENGKWLDS